MSLQIVKYHSRHTKSLRRIYLDSRIYAFPWKNPADFRLEDFDDATEGEEVLVALYEDKPVGFIAWWPANAFIHSLFIEPAHTGQGIGRELLSVCLKQINQPATLKCLQANVKALKFYYAHGWTKVSPGKSSEGPYFLLTSG